MVWILLVVLVLMLSLSYGAKAGLILFFSLLYGWYLFWASANIRSGAYIPTVNCRADKHGQVALTFDDGPDGATSGILDLLARYNAKGSFFMIGAKITGNENVLRRMAREGHLVGNHSWGHAFLFPVRHVKKIRQEIISTRDMLEQITSLPNDYFRPPYGVTNPLVARALKGLGMRVVGWTVRSLDTRNEPVEEVFRRITKNLKGGDIVLLHDTSAHILPLLEQLLIWLQEQGLEAVTVEKLLKD
ncbi:MAG: polysaccharide deacetylase family protein [Breznakibacter sp.]